MVSREYGKKTERGITDEMLRTWHKTSREVQTRLITYRIIHRNYLTPSKMARLKLRDSDVCWRYDRSKGTLVHMLYECSMTWTLWEKITTFINKVLGTELRQDPGLCMLGIMTEGVILTSRQA